jgi:hypothetical protein
VKTGDVDESLEMLRQSDDDSYPREFGRIDHFRSGYVLGRRAVFQHARLSSDRHETHIFSSQPAPQISRLPPFYSLAVSAKRDRF